MREERERYTLSPMHSVRKRQARVFLDPLEPGVFAASAASAACAALLGRSASVGPVHCGIYSRGLFFSFGLLG